MVNPYAGVLKYADGVAARGISIVTEAADDEATVLATVAAGTGGPAGAMVIAEYPAGPRWFMTAALARMCWPVPGWSS